MMGMGSNPFYLAKRVWTGRNAPLVLLMAFFVAFVWWIGPKLPYPFNSVVVRSMISVAVLGGVGAFAAWRRRQRAKNTDKLVDAVVAPDESEVLKSRFKGAVRTLKQAEKTGRKGLMDLPWYIIIGPPGSGKTTLLRNAGLNFPIEDESGSNAIKGVGGTRDCDWWFTDEAVLLDTAGRYTTQDSDEETDRRAWLSFLTLLKGRRRRRPINGIFVAIGADILLSEGPDGIREHAATIRKRILELYSKLQGRFPVYLLVTKIDLVPGFSEFFEPLTAEQREQVFGYTQQVIREGAEVAKIDANFDGEFELLLGRLSAQMLDRVRDEPDPRRRSLILGFPEQLARARHRMRMLVTHSFAPNNYQESILLRGVYMTSGTQEGTPIDRMMGGLARAMRVDPQVSQTRQPTGRSYFIKDFLSKVAFREQDLLGFGYRQAQRRRRFQIGAYTGIIGIAALALVGWTYVYLQERDYVESAEQSLEAYRREVPPAPMSDAEFEAQARAVVLRLDRLDLARQDIFDADPADTTLFLPGDNALIEAVDQSYHAQLNKTLAPLVASSLRTRLQRRDDVMQQVEAFDIFELNLMPTYVRAYASLEDPRTRLKSDAAREALHDAVMFDLSLRNPVLAGDLAPHVRSWVDQPRGPTARAVDRDVLEGARASLAYGSDGLGQARAAYTDWLFGELNTDVVLDERNRRVSARAPGLVDQLGLSAAEVFQRRSGRDLNEPIPAVFTRDRFERFLDDDIDSILDSVERDSWVYRTDVQDADRFDRAEAKRAITNAYVADYIGFWRNLLSDVTIKRANRTDVLRLVSRNPSPLKEFLKIVVSNTKLQEEESGSGPRRFGGLRVGPRNPNPNRNRDERENSPKARVTNAFAGIAELFGTEGEDGETRGKIDDILVDIRTLANEMAALEAGDTAIGDTTQAKRNLESLARDLDGSAEGLNLVVRDIVGASDRGRLEGETSQLDRIYRQDVLPVCRRKITGRFPFNSGANREVGLRDLEDVFGPDGVMTRFIDDNLAGAIDRSRGGWTWTPDVRGIANDSPSVAQFEKAARIRENFFGSGGLGFDYSVRPVELHGDATRALMAVGGEEIDYYGQQSRPQRGLAWPEPDARLEIYGPVRPAGPIEFTGEWALFRMIDAASSRRSLGGGTSMEARFDADGNGVTYRIGTDSVDNPLSTMGRWRSFRCPAKLW